MTNVTNINTAKGRKRRKSGLVGTGREEWHGSTNGYRNYGCRCPRCKEAQAAFMRDYRARTFGGKDCRMKGCPRVASQATGNGLCAHHHEKRKALRAAKAKKRGRSKTKLKAVR